MLRALLAGVALTLCIGSASAEDPIREKLETAKANYETDLERLRKSVASHLDDREKRARADGNKALVDQVKADRDAFEQTGQWPTSTPAGLTAQRTAAANRMEASYKNAIGEYIKGKLDDKAAGVEIERESFRREKGSSPEKVSRPEPTLEDRLERMVWALPNGKCEFARGGIFRLNGQEVGRWAAISSHRVVSVKDDGNHYDLYVFDKDFKQMSAQYIGRPGSSSAAIPMMKK